MRPLKIGPLSGGAFLPTASIAPGETKVVEVDCYKQFMTPKGTEAFALPNSDSEDHREQLEGLNLSPRK